jgi:hypothetical protein
MGLFNRHKGLSAGTTKTPTAVTPLTTAIADRYMFDSSDGDKIPSDARMVAGYPWWTQEMWNRFQANQYGLGVLVVQNHTMNRGDVLDIEPGCEWPITGAISDWITMRKDAGYYRPSVYCSASNIGLVRQATGKHVLGKDYDLWVAEWTGAPHNAYAGSSATQYASNNLYDVSYVYDPGWPYRVAPKPTPPPPPPPPVAEPTLTTGATGTAVKTLQTKLNAKGAKLSVDGVFGALTTNAVLAFQKKVKIAPEVVVGPVTWKALG